MLRFKGNFFSRLFVFIRIGLGGWQNIFIFSGMEN